MNPYKDPPVVPWNTFSASLHKIHLARGSIFQRGRCESLYDVPFYRDFVAQSDDLKAGGRGRDGGRGGITGEAIELLKREFPPWKEERVICSHTAERYLSTPKLEGTPLKFNDYRAALAA